MEDYKLTYEEIIKKYKTTLDGLDENERKLRLKVNGLNVLKIQDSYKIINIIINQFKNLLVWMLLISALVSFILNKEEYIDSILIICVVVINILIGAIQEIKAKNSLKRISKLESYYSYILSNGKKIKVESSSLVVGDIVVLETGSLIPADIRILKSNNLYVLESALTGEETSTHKNNLPINESLEINSLTNMLFKGTFISEGDAIGVVVSVGNNTQIGQILKHTNDTKEEKTPMEEALNKTSKVIGVIIIGVCLVIYTLELFITKDFISSLILSISLAVAAIPEGLQSVLTTVMAISVLKMSKNKAIVKRMPQAQALGAVNVIACDKTGTITTGSFSIVKFIGINKTETEVKELFNLATLNNSNKINTLLYNGHEKEVLSIPFSSVNKYELLVYKDKNEYISYIKGAFDVIYDYSINKSEFLFNQAKKEALNQNKVLFVGYKKGTLNECKIPTGMILEGMVSFKDQIRDSVKSSIQEAKLMGVNTIMITGDFKDTAFKIAKEVGIINSFDEVISHEELLKLTDEELLNNLNKYSVYSRVLPIDKQRIVEAYIKRGDVIAYTGDGINDAPALKKASIGIAVENALDIAKDSCDMILLDSSFDTISYAIKDGRRNFHNIRKAIRYLLSSNIGEVLVVFFVAVLNVFNKNLGICLYPLQLLWINLVTDTLPAISLGIDNNEGDYPLNRNFIDKKLVITIFFEGLILGSLSLISFLIGAYLNDGSKNVMCFLTISFSQLFLSMSLHEGKKINKLLIISVFTGSILTFITTLFFNNLFNMPKIGLLNYIISIILAIMYPIILKIKNKIQ